MRSREEIETQRTAHQTRIRELDAELEALEQEKPGEWKASKSVDHRNINVRVDVDKRRVWYWSSDPFSEDLAEFVAMLLNNGQRFSKRHWVQNMTYTDEADMLFDELRKLNGRGEES